MALLSMLLSLGEDKRRLRLRSRSIAGVREIDGARQSGANQHHLWRPVSGSRSADLVPAWSEHESVPIVTALVPRDLRRDGSAIADGKTVTGSMPAAGGPAQG